ncbi:unnamed protein product [Gadus morhua 'NCC']
MSPPHMFIAYSSPAIIVLAKPRFSNCRGAAQHLGDAKSINLHCDLSSITYSRLNWVFTVDRAKRDKERELPPAPARRHLEASSGTQPSSSGTQQSSSRSQPAF